MIRIGAIHAALAFAGVLSVAACGEQGSAKPPAPMEISGDSIAEFCNMEVSEHGGPKAQIFVASRTSPYWFASVRDAFAFTMLPEEPKDIVAIYVNDMGEARNWDRPEPGTWIEARRAVYIVGSRRRGGMGVAEAVPFSDPAKAQAFAAQFGGRVAGFDDVPKFYPLQESDGPAGDGDVAGHAQQNIVNNPGSDHDSPHEH